MWPFMGSVLIGFHWPNYASTWEKLPDLHTAPQQRFSGLLVLGSRRLLTLALSLGSRWYHLCAFYCYHSQEKPWCLPPGRSHGLTWSSGSQNCQIPRPILRLRPQFYACSEIEIWHLIHDALNFLLDNDPTQEKKKKPKQPLDDTRWQHKMLNEPARDLLPLVLLGAHSLIPFDLIHFNWLITQCKQQ